MATSLEKPGKQKNIDIQVEWTKLFFENRSERYTDQVFAGLAAVILIGLLVKNIVFHSLECVTVRRRKAALIRRRLDSFIHACRRAWRASTRSEVVMDWLDLSTAVLAVIAAVASLVFPLQRGQPDAHESYEDHEDHEGRERWRQSRR